MWAAFLSFIMQILGMIFRFGKKAVSVAGSAVGGILRESDPAGTGDTGTILGGVTEWGTTLLTLGTQATLLNESGALKVFTGKSGAVQTAGSLLSNPLVLLLGGFLLIRGLSR